MEGNIKPHEHRAEETQYHINQIPKSLDVLRQLLSPLQMSGVDKRLYKIQNVVQDLT